jgi:hypothetical protein
MDNILHNLKERIRPQDSVEKILRIVIMILLLAAAVSYAQESLGGNPNDSGSNNRGGLGAGGFGFIGRGLGGGPRGSPGD